MELKAFKYMIAGSILLANAVKAQDTLAPAPPPQPSAPAVKLDGSGQKLKGPHFEALDQTLASLDIQLRDLDLQLKSLDRNLSNSFKGFEESFNKLQSARLTEKTKTLSRTFKVSSKDKLSINNQYGNVTINTWLKNEIKVDVVIRAFDNSADNAQSLLEGVTIQESRQGNTISFRTSIERGNVMWKLVPSSGRQKRGVQVDYDVYMPSKNPLDISNKYGSTKIPDFEGRLNINSSYGSFSAKRLSNPGSRIESKYGSASMESLKSGSVNVRYGSLNIENAQSLQADVSYASVKIGRLSGSSGLNIRYSGKCTIDEIDKGLKDLNINAAYSSIVLGFAPAMNFDFDVSVNYAGFKFDDKKINIISKTPDEKARGFHPAKNYKGRYGAGSGSTIKIVSNYGSVQFL